MRPSAVSADTVRTIVDSRDAYSTDWLPPALGPAAFTLTISDLGGGAVGAVSTVRGSNLPSGYVVLDAFGPDGLGTTPHEIEIPTAFGRLSVLAVPSGTAVVSIATNCEPRPAAGAPVRIPEPALVPGEPSWPRHWPPVYRHLGAEGGRRG